MVDVLGVRLDRVGRDVQALADFLVGKSLGQQFQHRDLAGGELLALPQVAPGAAFGLRSGRLRGLGLADQQIERSARRRMQSFTVLHRSGLGLFELLQGLSHPVQQAAEVQALAFLLGRMQTPFGIPHPPQADLGACHQHLVAHHHGGRQHAVQARGGAAQVVLD
ncbi:hypothetical protein FQZ97_980170 [compost metagenome]